MRAISIVGAVAAVLTLATAAPGEEDEHWARHDQNRVGLDFDIFPSEQPFVGSTTSLSWGIPAQLRLVEHVYLDAWLGWAFIGFENFLDDGFVFGNISLGAHYTDTLIDELSLWAGGNIAIPTHLADLEDADAETEFAALAAVGTRGLAEPYRFFPEHFPIRLGGGVEARPIEVIYLRSGLWFGHYIPLNDRGTNDFEFVMEWPTEVEARAPFGLGGGLGFQQIFPFTDDPATGDDVIQLGLEWFVQYEPPGPGLHARLGWFWALDEELGFAFDEGKVMSLRFSVGGHW